MEAFGFTLDSLLASESMGIQITYIVLSFCFFVIGMFNNLCSYLTFKRPEPRKTKVGNYLFVITILNQCALAILLFRFAHVLLGMFGWTTNVSCKTISYLLSVNTRSTYWLASWVTIDRLLITVYPTSNGHKNYRVAIYSSIVTIFVLFGMHVHEILVYTVLYKENSSALLCVANLNSNIVAKYNRVSTIFHYLAPFSVQVLAVTLLILHIARSRSKTIDKKLKFSKVMKEQFNVHKELYITPAIIILCALPQIILAFTLGCKQLSLWQRHTMLFAYLLSYIPHLLGFILYVLPSSKYQKEFSETSLAKKYFKWMFKPKIKQHPQRMNK
jgi:hypothetical protein